MSIRILVSHAEGDMVRADQVVDVLRAAFAEAEVVGSALPGNESPQGAGAWLRQELAGADVLAAMVTPAMARAQEVAFQLGAAWALGKRIVLLLDPDGASDAFVLGLSEGEPVVLAVEPFVEMLRNLGQELGVPAVLTGGTEDALGRLFRPDLVRAVISSEVTTVGVPGGMDAAGARDGGGPAPAPPPPAGSFAPRAIAQSAVGDAPAEAAPRVSAVSKVSRGEATLLQTPAPVVDAAIPGAAAVAAPQKRARETAPEMEAVTVTSPERPAAKGARTDPEALRTLEEMPHAKAARASERAAAAAAEEAAAAADEVDGGEGDVDTIPPAERAANQPPPESAARPGLPPRALSLAAGRAFSDVVFHRLSESDLAGQLDAEFGPFLDALGGNWSALRPLGDPEVWIEAADNVLDTLGAGEEYVRAWYEVGYQLSTLINVLGALPDADDEERQELEALWDEAWGELQEWAASVGFDRATVSALGQMLDNLRGPEAEREYTFMAQVQELVRGRAEQADADAS